MTVEGPVGGEGTPPDSVLAPRTVPGLAARVFRYDLGPGDALAWETLPSEARGWRKVGVFAPWVALGMAWGASGDMASPVLRLVLTGGAGLVVFLAASALTARARRRRARTRVPRSCRMQCEDHGDHLARQSLDPPGPTAFVAPETIRQIVNARGRLFIDAPPTLVILPAAAFADGDEMTAFAAAWQDKLDALDAAEEAQAV